jgi:hypothetical protein
MMGLLFSISLADLPIGMSFVLHAEIILRAQSSIDVDARSREINLGMIPDGYEDEDGMFSFFLTIFVRLS